MLRNLLCFGTTLWFALPSVRALSGADNVVIALKEEAAVASKTVSLSDVAVIRNANEDSSRLLSRIVLGPAPEFGSSVVVNRIQIQESIRSQAVSLSGAILTGAEAVQVRLQGRPVDSSEILLLLKSCVLESIPWKDAEIEIHSIGGLKGIEVPADAVELRALSKPTIVGRNRIIAPIEVVHAGKVLRCFWVTAEISVRASVAVASRRIPSGKQISDEDLLETSIEIPNLRAAYVSCSDAIIGKASRRNFAAGEPLTREAFSEPFLVRHGEIVRLRLERNGIVLTAKARAEQDGKLGDVIKVRNLDFSTTLAAQVTGRGAVTLQ